MRVPVHLASLILTASWPAGASAACEALVSKADSAQGEAAADAYGELIACDRDIAAKELGSFLRAAGDVESVVALAITAIEADLHEPIWNMLEQIPDHKARDEIARAVGAQCEDSDATLSFVLGAWDALRPRPFGTWRDALVSCPADELEDWLVERTIDPPAAAFDDKYIAVVDALVRRQHADALPHLEAAAIVAAGNGGPFSTIIDKMQAAVKPETFGADPSPEHRAELTATLTRVAHKVPAEQAALVADRIYQAGDPEAAAALLPAVYPDRVQGKGMLLYGVASVEACEGEAIVHWAEVREPAKRWSILDDVEGPARAFKPRLKCESEEPWPVLATPSPVGSSDEIEAWAQEIVQKWEKGGTDTKEREEKTITLD